MKNTSRLVEGAGSAFHFEEIYPAIGDGRFPVKRIVGEPIEVWADIYRDDTAIIKADLAWRREDQDEWHRRPMTLHSDDRWFGSFVVQEPGRYCYAVEAWTDQFATWRDEFATARKAGGELDVAAIEGAGMLTKARAGGAQATAVIVRQCEAFLQSGDVDALLADDLAEAMAEGQFRTDLNRSQVFPFTVERRRAGFGAWYEMMPRSQGGSLTPATLTDCAKRLSDVAAMNFDVVLLPPLHPIGSSSRSGHPESRSIEELQAFTIACADQGLEVALTFAAWCSPDHPWVREHPRWFRRRPDGSLAVSDDRVTFDWTCGDAAALWHALRDDVLFWIDQGIRIFRADRPQSSPLPFWEWLIREAQRRDPEVIFLANALTRPKVMKGLAKLGFSQSTTHFTSCVSKDDLAHYLGELTCYPTREYMRPNFVAEVHGNLPVHPHGSDRWMFQARAALAAMLSANYGISEGFELLESDAAADQADLPPDRSNIVSRDWDRAGNIKPYLALINRVRRDNTALRQTTNLRFVHVDDADVIAFVKQSADSTDAVAVVIALSRATHEVWLPIGDTRLDIGGERRHVAAVENLLTGARTALDWGGLNVRIEPDHDPAVFLRCLA